MKTIKCAVCNNISHVSQDLNINKFLSPNSDGARLYFDLWHFGVEKCEHCGYASRNISKCDNANIKYLPITYDDIIKELNDARPNKIGDYISASAYYQLVGDRKNKALCLIQAGDLVYNEILYWKEFILTEDERCDDFYQFGDKLYHQGINELKQYLDTNPHDIDMQLVLVGVLNDMDDQEIVASRVILQNLKKANLTDAQKEILVFLEDEIC